MSEIQTSEKSRAFRNRQQFPDESWVKWKGNYAPAGENRWQVIFYDEHEERYFIVRPNPEDPRGAISQWAKAVDLEKIK